MIAADDGAQEVGMAAEEPRHIDETLQGVRSRRERLRRHMEELEDVIAAPAPGREKEWTAAVAASAAALVSAFDHHVTATEGPRGFLQQVTADAPRLSHAVQRLRDEHGEIAGQVAALERSAREAATDGSSPADLRSAALDVLGRLARHRHLGADLVYEAYQVDIGPAD
jgi:hypothetical protein